MTYVLDTNVVTAILKGNEKAKSKARDAIIKGEDVLINAISYYEIKRGLLAINATTKLEKFNLLCKRFGLLLLGT